MGRVKVGKKKRTVAGGVSAYANLASKHRVKKDARARKKAEYLATLPKHPVKRLLYRLHPKRLANYWFSRDGAIMALKIFGVATLLVVISIASLFAYFRKDLDQINPDTLSQRVKTTITKYYDRNDKLLWEDKGAGNYTLVVDPKTIAPCMSKATVAIEDKDFYKHGGISITGIMRAFISNSRGNDVQGGSTLTQQLVKQVFLRDEALRSGRGLAGVPRKIKEMILAIEVERMYSKDQILGLYLNESPYGGRRNGVESAAQTYFGKTSKSLTLPECALLAAIPNNPSLYNPYNTYGRKALLERQRKVLDDMVSMDYISKNEAEAAKKVDIMDTIKPLADQYASVKAPHFVQMVKKQLEEELGKTVVGEGGLTVKTTLDLDAQTTLEANMTKLFNGEITDSNCGYRNCSSYAGFANGAAAIEDTKTGQLIALLGSRDFNYAGFGQDNAATAFIQPGSSIKPLIYARLFSNQGGSNANYGSGSILADTKTTFSGGYSPNNADNKFQGNITLRQALARSRNIPAIKAMAINEKNNSGSTWSLIRSAGDLQYCTQGADAQAGLSSAIGGCGTRLVDHVNAFATLGRMGTYKPQTTILKVSNSNGQTLKQYKESSKQVIDQQAAYIVNDILGDGKARSGLAGRDYLVNLGRAGVKAAVKTGTSNSEINGKVSAKDIWAAGYTPNLSMAVWLGNSDTSPLRNGNSLIPAMFFDRTMTDVSKMYAGQGKLKLSDWYTAPNGIQNIKGEIYPSYYNKASAATNAKMTFDRVSKKKATSCTPEAAKIEVDVMKMKDPITKKEVVTPNDSSYNADKDDDAHSCDDAKPTVTLTVTSGGVSITYTGGRYKLQNIELLSGSTVVASKQVDSSGVWNIPKGSLSSASSGSLTAKITDTGYYTSTSTASYSSSSSSSSDDDD